MQVIQFHNGGFTWVNCRLTIIDDLLRGSFGLSLSSLCAQKATFDGRALRPQTTGP